MEFDIQYYDLDNSPEVDRRIIVAKAEANHNKTRINIHMAVFDRTHRRPSMYLYTGSTEIVDLKSGELLDRYTILKEEKFESFDLLKRFILSLLDHMDRRAIQVSSGDLLKASNVPLFSDFINSID